MNGVTNMKSFRKITAMLLAVALSCSLIAANVGTVYAEHELNDYFKYFLYHVHWLTYYDVDNIPESNDPVLEFIINQALIDGSNFYYANGEKNTDDFGITYYNFGKGRDYAYYVSVNAVDKLILRHFGVKGFVHRSVSEFTYDNGRYYWAVADGGYIFEPDVLTLQDNKNGTFSAMILVKDYGWAADGNEDCDFFYVNAVIQPFNDNGVNTYQLLYWDPNSYYYDPLQVRQPLGSKSRIRVFTDGREVPFDQPPILENGRTLVPVRGISEALGMYVSWEESTQTVTAERGNITVIMQIGSTIMTRNGEEIILDVPAKLLNGRTLIPVRAVSEAYGADVDWVEETQWVLITSNW